MKECHAALEQIAEAERAITGAQTVPSGLLRIGVIAAYGTHRLLPLMPRFTEAYPQIEIELSISDKIIDFVKRASKWRYGSASEDAPLGAFATPEYLKKRGRLATICHPVTAEPPSIRQGTRICGFFALTPPFNAGSIMVFT